MLLGVCSSKVKHQTKVANLANTISPNEDVLRLDVHVDVVVLVQVLQRLQQVHQVGPHSALGG